jgi:hypothetical protein
MQMDIFETEIQIEKLESEIADMTGRIEDTGYSQIRILEKDITKLESKMKLYKPENMNELPEDMNELAKDLNLEVPQVLKVVKEDEDFTELEQLEAQKEYEEKELKKPIKKQMAIKATQEKLSSLRKELNFYKNLGEEGNEFTNGVNVEKITKQIEDANARIEELQSTRKILVSDLEKITDQESDAYRIKRMKNLTDLINKNVEYGQKFFKDENMGSYYLNRQLAAYKRFVKFPDDEVPIQKGVKKVRFAEIPKEDDEDFLPYKSDDEVSEGGEFKDFLPDRLDDESNVFEEDDVKGDDELKNDDNENENDQAKGNLPKVQEYLSKVQKINEAFKQIEMLGLRTGSPLAKLAFYNRTEEGLEAFEQFMNRGMTNADYLSLYNREMPLRLAVKSGSDLAKVAFTSETVEGLNAFKQFMGRAMTNDDFLYLYGKDMPQNLQNF